MMPRMGDAIHLKVYQRFFAVTASVLPGLNLVLGLTGLALFLLADVIGMEWGWGIGISAILMCAMAAGWIFVGMSIEAWAEQKPTGILAGISVPFIVLDAILMLWLFVETVIFAKSPGADEEEALRLLVDVVSAVV